MANNDDLDKNDKFAKVRLLINLLNKQCLEHFFQEQHISVDESMVPYYGKHEAKQYIQGKPIKFCYKMWVAAIRLGYVIQLFPYQGAGTIYKELGLGGPVVDQLVSKLSKDDGNCYHIIFDNFFTGMTLLCHLKEKYGFAATGTIRSNRTGSVPLRDANKMEKEKRDRMIPFLTKTPAYTSHDGKIVRWLQCRQPTLEKTPLKTPSGTRKQKRSALK